MPLPIVFDGGKDTINRRLHGISLGRARDFEMDTAIVDEDVREDYGEERFVALGRLDRSICVLVFTHRADVIRVISLRRAEKDEREIYLASR